MKAKITLSGALVVSFCALLGACNDGLTTLQAPPPPTKDVITTQKLENVPDEFTFTPITKVGCDTLEQIQGSPMSEYFQAFEDPDVVNVELAQQALVKLHKQLRCMSVHDLYTNYKRLMYDLEVLREEDPMWATRVVPLLYLLTEHELGRIDGEAKRWLTGQAYLLQNEWENLGYFNGGIGFFFARAEGLVKMEDTHALLLVDSFRSATWSRAYCSFTAAVFLENGDESSKMLCLSDSCPRPYENIFQDVPLDGDGLPDIDAFNDACQQAKSDLQNATGAGSSTNSSSGSSTTSGQAQVGQIAQCVAAHNPQSAGGYTCAVRTALGGKSLGEVVNSYNPISTGVDFKIHSNGCATNPYAHGGPKSPIESQDEAYDRKRREKYANARRIEEQLQKDFDALYKKSQDTNRAGFLCRDSNDPYHCQRAAEMREDFAREHQCADPKECTAGEVRDILQDANKVVKNASSSIDAVYGTDRKESDKKYGYQPTSTPKCDTEGCSTSCSAADELITQFESCLGIDNPLSDEIGAVPQPTEDEMNGLAPFIYPDPDQWNANHGSALANCAAEAMGWTVNLSDSINMCGSLILCDGAMYSGTVSNESCSCNGASNLPATETVRNCSSLILCNGQGMSCTCNTTPSAPQVELPTAGGLPGGPEIFMQSGLNWSQN